MQCYGTADFFLWLAGAGTSARGQFGVVKQIDSTQGGDGMHALIELEGRHDSGHGHERENKPDANEGLGPAITEYTVCTVRINNTVQCINANAGSLRQRGASKVQTDRTCQI